MVKLVHGKGACSPVHRLLAFFAALTNGARPLFIGQRGQDAQEDGAADFEIGEQIGKDNRS